MPLSPARFSYLLLLAPAAVVVGLDQVTKTLAQAHLRDGSVQLVRGVLSLRLTYNSGGAFGVLQGMPGVFLAATAVVIAALLYAAHRTTESAWLVPFGLVLGGGLGNVVDRIFRSNDGRVIDFIHIRLWPTFNVADSAISIGVLLILLVSARSGTRAREAEPAGGREAPSGE